ncbi:MAG: hypothetical protein HW408_16 [Actinobacteria bacterium]|nr:hypothetical protein [Actinomycetota bacterium]
MKDSLVVAQLRGELARRQHPPSNLFYKRSMLDECPAWCRMRIQYPNMRIHFTPYDLNRFQQIRIVCDQNRRLKISLKSVVKQMGRQVDIGTFFFRFNDTDIFLISWFAPGKWHADDIGQKMSEYNFHIWKGPQRPEINLLSPRLPWVVTTGTDPRSEVFDPIDRKPGKQQAAEPV